MPRAKPLKKTRSESEVLAGVLRVLRAFGIDCDRQNTSGFYNPNGQYVRNGRPGNTDVTGMLPRHCGGRKLDIEVKAEGFDPRKLRGKDLARWRKQKARIDLTNANGGVAFWCDDEGVLARLILPRLLEGYLVQSQDDDGVITLISPRHKEP